MEFADLLIGNGRLVTRDDRQPFLEDGCVAVRGGLIASIGPTRELLQAHPSARFLDAHGDLILPGLINTHTHLYSAFARGIDLRGTAPADFTQVLERLWWRLDKALTLDDVYWSAMVGMLDSIRNGVTTIFDHHASPNAVSGSLFRIADAAQQTGLRSCLCYEVSDRDGAQIAAQGIEENRAFLERSKQSPDDRLCGLFGLHASFTLSDKTLARSVEAAASYNAGFHVHTAEALSDVDHCLQQHNMRVVERWHDRGILGRRTLAAHCVHINGRELNLLRETGTKVIHNPQSNMGNAVGCAPVLEMMRRGVSVGLGTDGYTPDMFESMKAASLLQKHHTTDPRAAWAEPAQMLFHENAAIATECFGRPVGKLIPGACADIILVEYDPPTPVTACNLDAHIHFGLSGRDVATTIIGGRVVMGDRKFVSIDEREVRSKSRAAADRLWQRF